LTAGLLAGGLGAILGHNWPLYFGFKGGKGVLTTFAVIMLAGPYQGLILLGVFFIFRLNNGCIVFPFFGRF